MALADRSERRLNLESLKHKDLQKLCKEYGLRANLKSEAMIDLLLDAQQSKGSSKQSRRSVSTRISSRATTTGRTSSMIVHDIDDDEESAEGDGEEEETQEQPEPQEVPQPLPRTRKAKETQLRLGMGRPVAAGGKGARAVTRSTTLSKSKKGKGSKSLKPSEATIPEEEPEPENAEPASNSPDENQAAETPLPTTALLSDDPSASSSSDFDARVMQAMKPLHQQLEALKSELGQMQALKNELSQIRNQVADIEVWKQRVETLTTEVKELREKAAVADSELQQLKGSLSSQRVSTPTSEEAASGFRTPVMTRAPVPNTLSIPRAPALVSESQAGPSYLTHPGLAPVLLGKRHRDSTSSDVTGVVEEAEESGLSEADLAKTVLRPDKKRPKLSSGDSGSGTAPEGRGEAARGASFTVFSGPEPDDSYIDPPPPTTPLPAFYTASTPPNNGAGPSRQRVTSTQDATENMPPFPYSFLPVPPTPGGGDAYAMPFPYPEPPQSPTPVRDSNPSLIGNSRDRTDVFQAFGLPPPGRPRSRLEPRLRSQQEAELGGFINPAALENRDGGESSTRSDDADAMRRTMYGTELEGDTRFGDFGLESIGSSDYNWTGAY